MDKSTTAFLIVRTWRGTLAELVGATHYYGRIEFNDKEWQLETILGQEQADQLWKEYLEGNGEYGMLATYINESGHTIEKDLMYPPDQKTRAFARLDDLYKEAIKVFHEQVESIGAKYLVEGHPCDYPETIIIYSVKKGNCYAN